MTLILNGINGGYLRDILAFAENETERVDAAVAYASDGELLFEWAWERRIPLRYWGRFDSGVPVSIGILRTFLARRSPNYSCRLLREFHAKVIWWRGYGAYIGSANLSGKAWWGNIEAGMFISESELVRQGHAIQLEEFFSRLDGHCAPLTEELFDVIERRSRDLAKVEASDKLARERFLSTGLVPDWGGLARTNTKSATERQREEFLKEWNATLQDIRNLADEVSKEENRPPWIGVTVPRGTQADQFLHAHYYQRTFENRQAKYEDYFERNKANPGSAVTDAIRWWRSLGEAPSSEDVTVNEWAPRLRELLDRRSIQVMTESDLIEIFLRVHAIRDHARRVSNATLGLPSTRAYSIEEKTAALARFVFGQKTTTGAGVAATLDYVLCGGGAASLPERIWEAVTDPRYRIDHFGISAIGEIVGWALPDKFPPRNGRTSKALRSLGFNVRVHA